MTKRQPILELKEVSKRYGAHQAVENLSFDVPRGSVFGLLGPNGAGKTTTIRMIMKIISPDSGVIRFDGEQLDDDRRRLIGYLPEERGLYKKMKVIDHLIFLGTIRGLKPAEARRRSGDWLSRLNLADWADNKVADLSKGMQQKVQFIAAILHEPRLLILDEPFSGLDPINTRELKDLLAEMRDRGATIVLSTHVLPQVDELCTHICLINRARAILKGALGDIRESHGGNAWKVRADIPAQTIAGFPGVSAVSRLLGEQLVELEPGMHPRELLKALVGQGELESFTRFVPDLENIFVRAVEGDQQDAS